MKYILSVLCLLSIGGGFLFSAQEAQEVSTKKGGNKSGKSAKSGKAGKAGKKVELAHPFY